MLQMRAKLTFRSTKNPSMITLLSWPQLQSVSGAAVNQLSSCSSPFAFVLAAWNGIGTKDLMKFLSEGGNVFAATGNSVSSLMRNFAAECGISMEPAGYRVVDHTAYDSTDGGHHTRIATNAFNAPAAVLGDLSKRGSGSHVLYEGVGMTVDPENFLTFKFLTAAASGVSMPVDKAYSTTPAVSSQVGLVVGSQGRNNARVAFVGSMWALSNEAFLSSISAADGTTAAVTANAKMAESVAQWAFQARAVLRASNIWHQHADKTPPAHQLSTKEKSSLPRSMYPYPEAAPRSLVYRIKEDLQYFVDLHMWDGAAWQPYEADDVQMEFVMLDPHLRKTLSYAGNGTYVAEFMTPDVYGVFKFRLHYQRPGLSAVREERQVTVRRFWHNEYERYILSAFPYYGSVFSMMAGVFVFSFVFLYVRPGAVFLSNGKGDKSKTQ